MPGLALDPYRAVGLAGPRAVVLPRSRRLAVREAQRAARDRARDALGARPRAAIAPRILGAGAHVDLAGSGGAGERACAERERRLAVAAAWIGERPRVPGLLD